MKPIAKLYCLLLFSVSLGANATELLKAETSWDGGAIYYPKGQAEVTAIKLRLEEGKVVDYHCHPVPTFGYILSGAVEVETKSGKKRTFKAGESIVEVMRTIHRGTAVGGAVEIIVFYAGSTSMPTMVKAGDERADKYCKD